MCVCGFIITSPHRPLCVHYVTKERSDFQAKAAAMKLSFADIVQIKKIENKQRWYVLLCHHTKGYFAYFQSLIVEVYSFS